MSERTMSVDDFARLVNAAAPSRAELLTEGLDDEEIDAIISSLVCEPRASVPAWPTLLRGSATDPVLRLLRDYECGNLEIAHFMFLRDPVEHPRGTGIARSEADLLVILDAGELVLFDHAVPGRVLSKVARSSDGFLQALACILRAGDSATQEDGSDALAQACAKAAGGDEYATLWRSLAYSRGGTTFA
jgi:hypothetical protein